MVAFVELGYYSKHKIERCMRVDNHSIIISLHVKFLENSFSSLKNNNHLTQPCLKALLPSLVDNLMAILNNGNSQQSPATTSSQHSHMVSKTLEPSPTIADSSNSSLMTTMNTSRPASTMLDSLICTSASPSIYPVSSNEHVHDVLVHDEQKVVSNQDIVPTLRRTQWVRNQQVLDFLKIMIVPKDLTRIVKVSVLVKINNALVGNNK